MTRRTDGVAQSGSRTWPLAFLGAAFLGLLGACVTVNVYFPAAEIEDRAEEIVEDVYDGVVEDAVETDSAEASGAPEPMSRSRRALRPKAVGLSARVASIGLRPIVRFPAQPPKKVEIDVSTPIIEKIRKSLEVRFIKLAKYYERGYCGPDQNGDLAVRTLVGLDLKERALLGRLVAADNEDRADLYREILAQNDLDKSRISLVRDIFAREWIELAKPGWYYVDKRGRWQRKPTTPKKDDPKKGGTGV